MKTDTKALHELLKLVQNQYYHDPQHIKVFYRDYRFLIHALSWPAAWMHERGVYATPEHYTNIITQRLNTIKTHGNPQHYEPYFPRYLLKTLQDYFAWHGDELYYELKHIRNHLNSINSILEALAKQHLSKSTVSPEAHCETLHKLHQLTRPQKKTKVPKEDPRQLSLL